MHDVLVHYLEVNFPEIAEQLAHARGREPSNEQRAAAAERLRELIRRLRRGAEGAGAPPHAPRVTAADLRSLRRSIVRMRERLAQGDPMGYSELNAEFHQQIWAIADHRTAGRLLANLKSQSIRFQYRTILRPGRTANSLREHELIVEALASRDPDASEAAMRQHLGHVVETLQWAIDAQRHQPIWLPR